MLILYTKNNCAYCDKVKDAFLEYGVIYEERNISEPEFLKEAQSHNARSMPFLFDTISNLEIRESDEIIDYGKEGSFQ
jgi:glutaredoxin